MADQTDRKPLQHLAFLDELRGFAIVVVFLYHSLGTSFRHDQLGWNGAFRDFSDSRSFLLLLPLTFGWAGVAVFFAISGFCIHLSHVRSSNGSLIAFFRKRFFRIYPPYLLALLVFAFVYPFGSLQFSAELVNQFVMHVTLLHNFQNRTFFGVNPSFWSIAVEVQLYVLYPLLFFGTRRWGWRRCLATAAVVEIGLRSTFACLWISGIDSLPRWFSDSPLSYVLSWSLGAWLADAVCHGRRIPLERQPLLLWGILSVASSFFRPTSYFSFLLFSLTTAVAIARTISGRSVLGFPVPLTRFLTFIGTVSYSLYLIHQPILNLIPRFLAKIGAGQVHELVTMLACTAMFLPILLVSWVSYRLVELPSAALGRR